MSGMKVEYELTDGGSTAKLTSATGLLKKNIDDVAASANRTSAAVKAAMAPSGGSQTKSALQNATMSPQEGIEYGQARAAAGTGAAGRDFAKQAQGLGGLVHVYATFAANLFAVSAAFTALKNAADTTNMIKGLDQLGARSGIALGNLSERVVALTDNAVSLREAMTATAQATAAGMTSANLERLAKVAKTAGDTLGIGTADALSRLSRGITKLEPELLDELGIFVRVDTAASEYATSIGKAASSLTDFEKRQAFAIAVLKQGEDKFSGVNIDTNPYQKLLSTIKNVAQGVLEAINSVFGPLVKYLADSPSLVLAALTAVTGYLLKQAIPAVQQYSQAIQASSAKENAAIKQVQEQRLANYETQKKALVDLAAKELQTSGAATEAAIDKASKIEKLALGAKSRYATAVNNILQGAETYQDIKPEQLAIIDKLGEKQTKIGKIYRDLSASIREAQEAHNLETAAIASHKTAQDALAVSTAKEIAAKKALEKVNIALALSEVNVNAAKKFEEKGLLSGISTLVDGLTSAKAGFFDKLKSGASGVVGLLGAQFGKLLGYINPIVGTITTLITVWQMADSAFSTNAKSVQKLNTNFDALESSIEGAIRTIDLYNSMDIGKLAPIERLKATTNAIQELSTNFTSVVTEIKTADATASGWDKFWDGFLQPIGKDIKSKTAKQLSLSITAAIAAAEEGPAKEEFKKKIKEIAGVDVITTEALDKMFTSGAPQQYLDTIQSSDKAFKVFQQATSVGTAKIVELDTAFDASQKAFDTLAISMQNTTPLSTFANTLVAQSQKITAALEEPAKSFENLVKITKDTRKLSLLDPNTLKELEQAQPVIDRINKDLAAAKSTLSAREKQLQDGTATWETKSLIEAAKSQVESLQRQAGSMAKYFLEAIQADGFKKAAGIFGKEIINATEEAAISIAKAKSALLTDEVAAKEQGRLTELQIQSSIKLVESNRELIRAHYMSIAQMKEDSANRVLNDSSITDQAKINAAISTRLEAQIQKGLLSSNNPFPMYEAIQGNKNADAIKASNEIFPQLQSLGGFAKEMVKLQGQLAANKISTDINVMTATKGRETKDLDASLKLKQSELDRLQALRQIVGYADDESLAREKILADTMAQLKLDDTIKGIEQKMRATQDVAQQKIYKTQVEQTREQGTADQGKRDLDYAKLAYDMAIVRAKRESDFESEKLAKLTDEKTMRQEIDDAQLQSAIQLGNFSDKTKANLEYESAAIKAKIAYEDQLGRAKIQQAEKFAEFEAKRALLAVTPLQKGETSEDRAAAIKQLNEQEAIYIGLQGDSNGRLREGYDLTLAKLGITKETSIEQARYNELLNNATSLADQLSKAFGDMGTKIGGVVTSLTKLTLNIEKNGKTQLKLEDDLAKAKKANDPKKIAQAEENLDKQKRQSLKDELDGISEAASATKKMFKEKTLAFKALSAVEQTTAAISMALKVQDMAVTISTLPAKIADGVATLFAQGGWAGFVGAAAFLAIMSQFGVASISGGAAAPPAGQSSEDKQKTQGTAQGYDSNGNLVQTNRGVFGDLGAKSESIANSLKVIEDTSVKGLDYDDKMLRALQNLTNALDDTAKGLYAITGLRAGSLSGVVEGTNTSGGFLGIGGLFSSSTSKSIIDSGIQLKGTFLDLVKGIKSTINTFEVISTTVKKSGFLGIGGSTNTSISTNFKQLSGLDPKAFQSLVSAFGYASDLLYSIADTANVASSVVTEAMSKVQVDQMASLRGLTGEEFTKELGAVIGNVLDQTALVIFSEYEQFAKFGEGMLETVVRVVDTNRKVLQQLKNTFSTDLMETLSLQGVVPAYKEAVTYSLKSLTDISPQDLEKAAAVLGKGTISPIDIIVKTIFGTLTSSAATKLQNLSQTDLQKLSDAGISFVAKAVTVINDGITRSFDAADIKFASTQITEDLARLAGGLQNFLDQSNYFLDNFFTAAERAVPVQKAVVKQLAALGYASVDTKAEFKALVQGLDLTDATARQTYQALMDIAPGFIEVFDVLDTQSQALKDTVSNFESFIKQIKDFKSSLLLSADSILTPAQKYAEAKAQFETVYAKAMTGDKDSLSKVTSSAQSFLDASRTYFASSEAYTTDFNTVLSKLDNSTISAQASIDVAQLQLDNLSIQTNLLTSINTNIALIAGVPAAASGGRVSGLTLVGEMGPELVDFSTPGRVYTADQTAGMFVPINGTSSNVQQVLVQELQNLRQEVAKLREQQSTETGHLINATYDAQNRNAEQVTEGVMDAAARQAWVANFRENALINK